MSQKSSKKETDKTEFHIAESTTLCINNCGFFGSTDTNNLCSKCYRDFIIKAEVQNLNLIGKDVPNLVSSSSSSATLFEQISTNLKTLSIPSSEKKPLEIEPKQLISKINRCLLCNKKLGLLGFKCRCGSTFCSTHRYPETHKCSFDYKKAGRDAIAKENPLVVAKKLNKI